MNDDKEIMRQALIDIRHALYDFAAYDYGSHGEHYLDEERLKSIIISFENTPGVSGLSRELSQEFHSFASERKHHHLLRDKRKSDWPEAGFAEYKSAVYSEMWDNMMDRIYSYIEQNSLHNIDDWPGQCNLNCYCIAEFWGEYNDGREEAREAGNRIISGRTSPAIFIMAFIISLIFTASQHNISESYLTSLASIALMTGVFFGVLWIIIFVVLTIAGKYIYAGWRRYINYRNKTYLIVLSLIPIFALILYFTY